MLPSAHRMRRSSEFAAVLRSGRRSARGAVVVHCAPPKGTEGVGHAADAADPGRSEIRSVRVGFVVPKAVGSAVSRNVVKRRLRAAMARRLDGLRGDVVVRALPGAATATFADLANDLDRALDAASRPGRRS